MAGHPRSLSWSAEDAGTSSPATSAPAFFPVEFERQTSATSVGSAERVWVPADESFGATRNHHHHHAGSTNNRDNISGATHIRNLSDGTDPSALRFGDPRDDLPLLEELGIFPSHIVAKSRAVLHPFQTMRLETVEDTDIAGPLCFTVLLGILLTLQGKLHFGAIYGLSVLGILLAQALLSLMSDTSVQLQLVISTLGYCLLPNALLAVFSTLHVWFIGRSPGVILPLSLIIIGWSAWCATSMFTQAFRLQHCRFLILYPATLFYAVFAALTIF